MQPIQVRVAFQQIPSAGPKDERLKTGVWKIDAEFVQERSGDQSVAYAGQGQHQDLFPAHGLGMERRRLGSARVPKPRMISTRVCCRTRVSSRLRETSRW